MKPDKENERMALNSNELKELGNKYYASRKYSDAIDCYTKAIGKNSSMAVYFTNRALCYLKLKQWEQAAQDCKRALETDSSSVKGHFFLGHAVLELGLYDESVVSLIKANELAKEQKLNFGDDITCMLRLARRKRWNILEEKRIQQEIELQTYLNKLIVEDSDRQASAIQGSAGGDRNCAEEIEVVQKNKQKRLAEVNDLFTQLDDRRKKRDVPDVLCGRISFELMRDPVITPSGITYDRRDIEQHIQRVGHFDPVTRADLTLDQLIPNLAMKEVVDSYVEQNPWAEDY